MVEEVSLTYAELATKLNIKLDSAKKLVSRRKWEKRQGNDGKLRILVPLEVVSGDVPRSVEVDKSAPSVPDMSLTVARLEEKVAGLEKQLAAEQRRADAAEARAIEVASDRDAWRTQAQRSLWSKLFG